MDIRYSCSPNEIKLMDTKALRDEFLIDNLFEVDNLKFVYSHVDRMMTGSVTAKNPVKLVGGDELKADYFLQRREMGVINIGGTGIVGTVNRGVNSEIGMFIEMSLKTEVSGGVIDLCPVGWF